MKLAVISAAWLREPRDDNNLIPINTDQALVLAEALDIADFAARNCVESYAPIEQWEPPRLYDLDRVNPRGSAWLDQAVRYLDARGMLQRDSDRPALIRVQDTPT